MHLPFFKILTHYIDTDWYYSFNKIVFVFQCLIKLIDFIYRQIVQEVPGEPSLRKLLSSANYYTFPLENCWYTYTYAYK